MQIDTSHTSPNHSSRNGRRIGMLVFHATVGSYDASLAWLCNPASRVSTHYLIRKDGHIAQLVDDAEEAWHAGKSFWRGMDSATIQATSLGIELENANTGHDPYPPAQLDAAIALGQHLLVSYVVPPENIVRHLDIATPPGRKTDPAGLDWTAFVRRLLNAPAPTERYRVKYQTFWLEAPRGDAPVALNGLAVIAPGQTVIIDKIEPCGFGHDGEHGVGFVPLAALEGPL